MNIRDFSDATVKALHLSSPGELFHLDPDKVKNIIGEVLRDKLFQRIEELKTTPYPDYRIIGSVGFSNIAIATWKTILQHYEVKRLIELHNPDEINCLSGIKGIGPKTVQTILHELRFFMWDLQELFSRMNVIYTPLLGNQQERPKQVVFTGFRDPSIEQQLEKLGFEIKPNVTNDTMFLVVPYIGFKSTKVDRVFKILSNKMSKMTGKPVAVDYTHMPKDVYPTIVDQAIVEDTISKLTNSETKI
jgi:NAD-dependent DNA ligase